MKGKKKGKAAAAPETHRCFHCQSESTKMLCCSQCHHAWYCGKACQKKHWKQHKRACVAAVAAEARRATRRREATEAAAQGGGGFDKETCVICVGPIVAPVELPCGHAYCGACLAELRAKKVVQACPMCRAVLPPGLDGLFELGYRAFKRMCGMVKRGEVSWESLPAALKEEMDEAVVMLTEAGAQGHSEASFFLGNLLESLRGDIDGAEAAYRAVVAADPGHDTAYYNLALLLEDERQDFDGAEAAYRGAIAADPGKAVTYVNLGTLMLESGRQDIDGAEAMYRAAIATDPGYAEAHFNLGVLLEKFRSDNGAAAAAYRAAIAADPGYPKAHFNLGVLLQNEGQDSAGAEAAYRDSIALYPKEFDAHTNLGILLEDRAKETEKRGGDLEAAAALCGECAQLWRLSLGADHAWTKAAQKHEVRLQMRAHGMKFGLDALLAFRQRP